MQDYVENNTTTDRQQTHLLFGLFQMKKNQQWLTALTRHPPLQRECQL